jgi:hypothetical protein
MEKVVGFHKYEDPDVRMAAQRIVNAAENLWILPLGENPREETPEVPVKTGQALLSALAMLRISIRKFHRVERRYGIFTAPLRHKPNDLAMIRESRGPMKRTAPVRKKKRWGLI